MVHVDTMEDSVHIYNPLNHGKGVGRRTGKIIQKKRNVNNGVENFEDYLSSDGDMTLNDTHPSTLKMRKTPTNYSVDSKVKQAVLHLQCLSNPTANTNNKIQKPGSLLEVSEDGKIVNLLTRNSNLGRRTGKVIEKKRNIANGVDNFEDYLSSDGEMSLNITDASSMESRDNCSTVSTRSSKRLKQDLQAPTITEMAASKLLQKSGSSSEVSQGLTTASLLTRNSRFGRRTGKDLLAGKDPADLNNFSNYLSDFNETASLLPSPPQPSNRSQSADSARSKMSPKPCQSESGASGEEHDLATTYVPEAGNENLLKKSSDEEDLIGRLSLNPRCSFKSNCCDLEQLSLDKESTPNATRKSYSEISSEQEFKGQNSNESQKKKVPKRKSSLAWLAIRNSAKRKSFCGNAIDLEIGSDPSKENEASEKDVAEKSIDHPIDLTITEVISSVRERLKKDFSKDSNSEKLNASELSDYIYDVQVDESIYFKITPGQRNDRESLKQSKYTGKEQSDNQDLEMSLSSYSLKRQSQSKVGISVASSPEGEADLKQINDGVKQKAEKSEKFTKNAAPNRSNNTLTDANTEIIANLSNLGDSVSGTQSEIKETHVSSICKGSGGDHKFDEKSNKNSEVSKMRGTNIRNTNTTVDCDKSLLPESEITLNGIPAISFKNYKFNDTGSESEIEKISDVSRDSSKVENVHDDKMFSKQNHSLKTLSVGSMEPAQSNDQAEESDEQLRVSSKQELKPLKTNFTSRKSSNDLHFISVSSKTIPHSNTSSGVCDSGSKLQKKVSKKSARRMLDLSQEEDSEGTASKEAMETMNIGNEHPVLKPRRGRSGKSKKFDELPSKVSLNSPHVKTNTEAVFMSISSKKSELSVLQKEFAEDKTLGLKHNKTKRSFQEEKAVTGVLNEISAHENIRNIKTVMTDLQNIEVDLLRENTRKRKSFKNLNMTDGQTEHDSQSPQLCEMSFKKKKKDSCSQSKLQNCESADVMTTMASKLSFMPGELKETPKTGNRQRFRNYRKKIFYACEPELSDNSGYKQLQNSHVVNSEDQQTGRVRTKMVESRRNPRTVMKKSKSQKLKELRKSKDKSQKVVVKKRQVGKSKHLHGEESVTSKMNGQNMNKDPSDSLEQIIDDHNEKEKISPGKEQYDSDAACYLEQRNIHKEDPSNQTEFAVTYAGKLKSASGKKRGRPRKSSLVSEKERASLRSANADPTENMESPVSVRLIDSLPSVTPRSGVSFRKVRKESLIREACHSSQDSGNVKSDLFHNEESKSIPIKKRGRPRKAAASSGDKNFCPSENLNGGTCSDGNESISTPLSMKLIDSLPHVTPQSGMSFRRPKSHSTETEDRSNDPDPYELSLQRFKEPDFKSTPCGRTTKEANGLTSCLRDSSVVRPFKKGRRVRINSFITSQPTETDGECLMAPDATSTTMLSLSSSPVHYAETTLSVETNVGQHSLLLPDLSHYIVRPEKVEPTGLRRSSRTRVKPVAGYKGERVVYRRDSTGFGLVVDAIQPSVGEAKIKANEEKKRKIRLKKKLKAMNVPLKPNKRLSSHVHNLSLEITQGDSLPAVNPETQEEVLIEIVSRRSNVCWKGPELEPVLDTDPLAGCVQLQQPSFSSGEIQLRALGKKAYEETMETLIYNVILGKVMLTINDKSTMIESGDDFCIPRGSAYGIKNLRRDVARLHFVCLHDNPQDNL